MRRTAFRIGSVLTLATLLLTAGLPAQAALHKRGLGLLTQTFQLAANARIVVGSNHSATLDDLKPGDRVSVAYDQENGVLIAHRVADGVSPHPRNPNGTKPKNHYPQGRPTLAHTHGVLQAVNLQAGTLTIATTPHRRRL